MARRVLPTCCLPGCVQRRPTRALLSQILSCSFRQYPSHVYSKLPSHTRLPVPALPSSQQPWQSSHFPSLLQIPFGPRTTGVGYRFFLINLNRSAPSWLLTLSYLNLSHKGIYENDEIIAFIRVNIILVHLSGHSFLSLGSRQHRSAPCQQSHQSNSHRPTRCVSVSYLYTTPLTLSLGTGFSADDGVSLLMAFRGLQAESIAQGQAHRSISKELTTLVADPFDEWAQDYKV